MTPRAALTLAFSLSSGPLVAQGLARFAYALLLPNMRQDLHWSYTQAGGMNTANALGYLLGALLAAFLLARAGVGRSFVGGMALMAVALLLSGLTHHYSALLGLRFLTGVAGALSYVAGAGLTAHLASSVPHISGRVLGMYFGGGGMGILLSGVFLPGYLSAQPQGWPWAWVLLGALALCATGVAARAVLHLLEPPMSRSSGSSRPPLPILGPAFLAYSLFGLGYVGYTTFVVAFLRLERVSALGITLFWSTLGLAALLGVGLWARTIQNARGGSALAALILTVTVGSLLPLLSSTLPMLLLSALLFGSAFLSTVTAVTTLVRRFLEPAAWTSALAWFTVAFALGQCFGPLLSGLLSDGSGQLELAFVVSSALLGLGALLAWTQRPAPS